MDTVRTRDDEVLAAFRNDRLRLTDRRLHYTGRGRRGRDAFEMRLSSVNAVGVTRLLGPYHLALVAACLLVGPALIAGLATQDELGLINGFLFSVVLLPFVLVGAWLTLPGHAIRIVASGVRLHVPVRRARLDQAVGFVRRAGAAIASERGRETKHGREPTVANGAGS